MGLLDSNGLTNDQKLLLTKNVIQGNLRQLSAMLILCHSIIHEHIYNNPHGLSSDEVMKVFAEEDAKSLISVLNAMQKTVPSIDSNADLLPVISES